MVAGVLENEPEATRCRVWVQIHPPRIKRELASFAPTHATTFQSRCADDLPASTVVSDLHMGLSVFPP